MRRFRLLRAGDVLTYRVCEDITEPLVYLMVIFSPWAFGSTMDWTVWIMNVAGFFLGALLAVKLVIRRLKGYSPPRWDAVLTGSGEWGAGSGERGAGSGSEVRGSTSTVEYPTSNIQHSTSNAESKVEAGRSKTAVTPNSQLPAPSSQSRLTTALGLLTALILGYCLISAVNAGSTYHRGELSFEYHRYVKWLPHSFDSTRTWFAFWSYVGLACSFWAVRDWLLGKTVGEERAERQKAARSAFDAAPLLPTRLRRLLWILSLNGGLLGLEGIAQRLEGSGRLLFLIQPNVNTAAVTQFGPYAYRGNAASYFNLLWPVSLGFWWTLERSSGFKPKTHHLLLLCASIMAACPIISTSRGGTLVTVGIVSLALLLLVGAQFLLAERGIARGRRRERAAGSGEQGAGSGERGAGSPAPGSLLPAHRFQLALLAVCLAVALTMGFALGWKALKPRMTRINEGFEGREQMNDAARPMAADYPLFGTGPGTFDPVFQLYRISTDTYWPAQLHNDWLETRITFGWVGSALIGLAFLAVALRWFVPGGIHGGRRFVVLMWLALAGCLVHARFDFPFQIHSIVFLFLILCALLSNLSRRA